MPGGGRGLCSRHAGPVGPGPAQGDGAVPGGAWERSGYGRAPHAGDRSRAFGAGGGHAPADRGPERFGKPAQDGAERAGIQRDAGVRLHPRRGGSGLQFRGGRHPLSAQPAHRQAGGIRQRLRLYRFGKRLRADQRPCGQRRGGGGRALQRWGEEARPGGRRGREYRHRRAEGGGRGLSRPAHR